MIYINDKLRINKLDENCLQLETYKTVEKKENGKKTGETIQRWEGCGFYGTIKQALIGAFRKQLFKLAEEELALKQLTERIDEAERNILRSIDRESN